MAEGEIRVNFHRLEEIHQKLEKSRMKLANLPAPVRTDCAGSPALIAFHERLGKFLKLIEEYECQLENDSRALYHIALSFSYLDESSARTYMSKIGSSLSNSHASSSSEAAEG